MTRRKPGAIFYIKHTILSEFKNLLLFIALRILFFNIYLVFIIYFSVNIVEQQQQPLDEKVYPSNMNEICNKALDGIVLITTTDGDIIFISENVSKYLGLSQVLRKYNYIKFIYYYNVHRCVVIVKIIIIALHVFIARFFFLYYEKVCVI